MCLYLHISILTHVGKYPRKPEEGIRYSGTEKVVWAAHCGRWKPNSGPLWDSKYSQPEYIVNVCNCFILKLLCWCIFGLFSFSWALLGISFSRKGCSLKQLSSKVEEGWWDGSMIKSTGCSSREPGFNSQHLHDGSQPPVITISWYLIPWALHTHGTQTCMQAKHPHT